MLAGGHAEVTNHSEERILFFVGNKIVDRETNRVFRRLPAHMIASLDPEARKFWLGRQEFDELTA